MKRLAAQQGLLTFALLWSLLVFASPVAAQTTPTTINVGSANDFNSAIQTINTHSTADYILNFTNSFTLNQAVPEFNSTGIILLNGNSHTIDGGNLYQPLVVDKGTVALQGLNVINPGSPITVNGNGQSGGTLVGTTDNLTGPITDNWIVNFSQDTTGTYSGVISGNGGVEISGSGTVALLGHNTYAGGTLVSSLTTLAGTTSSIQGNIIDLGNVQFNQAADGTFAGAITGTGGVQIMGGGTITFTGLNTYLGVTSIGQGSALVTTTANLKGAISNGGNVTFNQNNAGTFSGNINGSGHLLITGGGAVTLTGTNSYTGGTTVDSGNSLIGTTNALQGAIVNNGQVQFNQTTGGVFGGNISGSGSVHISGAGEIVFSGTNSYTGGTIVDSGSILAGSAPSLQGQIANSGSVQFTKSSSANFDGIITGSGSVEIKDNISATFTGMNSYTGGTIVDNGATLTGTTVSLQGNIVNNGTLQFDTSANTGLFPIGIWLTPVNGTPQLSPDPGTVTTDSFVVPANTIYSGNITGTGSVHMINGGTMTLTGTNTYSGGTTIDAGNMVIGTTNSLQGAITNNGWVKLNQASAGTFFGSISGTGSVDIAGAPITMTGLNTYSGGTWVESGGTLIGGTFSVQGAINNNGAVKFMQGSTGTYSGNMIGFGSVEIGGGGTVLFSGTNSYSGGTTVDAGSKLFGTTNSLQGSIVDNGLVKFAQTAPGTFAGSISGTGGVEIGGIGAITFSGINTYTGGTTIDNGSTLIVGSTGSITGNINVNNGGVLMGQGSLSSVAVNAGGVIFPGTVGSPLTIHGDFTQGAGSKYSVELSPTAGDQISVTGAATISSGTVLNLVVDPGQYTVGKNYEILTAAGGLNGKYSFKTSAPMAQKVVFNEQYSANSLQLVVNSNLLPSAQTTNQISLAAAIDQTSGSATGSYAAAITQLTSLSGPAFGHALNQISGDIFPSLSTIQRQTTTAQLQLLSNRLAGLTRAGMPTLTAAQPNNPNQLVSMSAFRGQSSEAPAEEAKPEQTWTAWAQGYGLGGNIAGDGNASGTSYQLGGTLFGIERWLEPSIMVGVLGGYSNTSVQDSDNGSSAQVSSYQAGLYELYREEQFYVSNIDAFVDNQFDVTRPINFGAVKSVATGNSYGTQWSHNTESGINLQLDELRLQPFIGIQYMYLDQRGYSESGAGGLDMNTGHQIVNSVRNSIGARVYHEATWGKTLIIPTLSARYQHEWGNGTQLITSSLAGAPTAQFVTTGNKTGRDFGLVSLGSTAFLSEQFSVYLNVDAQVASNFYAVIGSGGFQYAW